MMKQINKTKTICETRTLRRLRPLTRTARSANKYGVGALGLLMLVSQAAAATFSFSTGEPDGKIADKSSPSPRALDSLPVEVRPDGSIWVNFQNFEAGRPEKIPVA